MGSCFSCQLDRNRNETQLKFEDIQKRGRDESALASIATGRPFIPLTVDAAFHDLVGATWATCTPFIPSIRIGYVIKVADGDSITIATKLGSDGDVYRFNVRLHGIDTPEMRGRDDDEKEAAREVKRHVEDLLLHSFVRLEDVSYDKYGRILARVYKIVDSRVDGDVGDFCVNDWLLESRMAVSYSGGTKYAPDNWMAYIHGRDTITQ